MFELRDIIPHVSVSDIIQKNKRREGRQQLKRARREPFKTFLIEVNCDSCEDGKIYNNPSSSIHTVCVECDGTGVLQYSEYNYDSIEAVRVDYPEAYSIKEIN